MPPRFFTSLQYIFLFALLFVVYAIGLFVPLMDNDAAHHATIALHMFRTGNYVNLVDHGDEYLDKPHLHFWLAALSYHLFGVTTFAYKFPSFLFTIAGVFAVYRLGTRLYNQETGKLAALIVSSAFAFVLSTNDVRMDAILTACVALATWQLVVWVQTGRWLNVVGAALALAAGFCTKGHIAVFTPGLSLLFYLAYTRGWKRLLSLQTLALAVLFFIFIAPVVYCYYLQYDLHPEKLVRGKSGRSGVAFILWRQNVERFQGDSFGSDAKNDYLFFLHSFLWAFAPWSLIAFTAFFTRFKKAFSKKAEWLTLGTFAGIGLLISFSGFKLPHYLNIIFPVAAVLAASYLSGIFDNPVLTKRWQIIQSVVCVLCLAAAAVLNSWMFPLTHISTLIGFIVLFAVAAYVYFKIEKRLSRVLFSSVATAALVFYVLNTNFYPQLLTYQGGLQLAKAAKGRLDVNDVLYWPGVYSSSFDFYSATQPEIFSPGKLQQHKTIWILTDPERIPEIKQQGYPILETITERDYEITRLKLNFLNPATRSQHLDQLMLLRIK